MNAPLPRYSPVGAVLDTCCGCTHHADVDAPEPHAAEQQMQKAPACSSVSGGTPGPAGSLLLLRTMTEDAPWMSACTYASCGRM